MSKKVILILHFLHGIITLLSTKDCWQPSLRRARKKLRVNFMGVPTVPMLDEEQRRWFLKFILTLSLLRKFWGICRWKKHSLVVFLSCINGTSGEALVVDSKGQGSANSIGYLYVIFPKEPCKSIPRYTGWIKASSKGLSHQALYTHQITWHRGECFCSTGVSTGHRPSFSDMESLVTTVLQTHEISEEKCYDQWQCY